MKIILKTFLILTATILMASCESKAESKDELSKSEEIKKLEEVKEDTHENEGILSLNNGSLWSANVETTTGINNMINLMNSFSDKESTEAYTTLKNNLEAEFNTILKECTMKGESHNQLHNFLVPMKEMFEGIDSSDLEICKINFNTLNKHLTEYTKYFK